MKKKKKKKKNDFHGIHGGRRGGKGLLSGGNKTTWRGGGTSAEGTKNQVGCTTRASRASGVKRKQASPTTRASKLHVGSIDPLPPSSPTPTPPQQLIYLFYFFCSPVSPLIFTELTGLPTAAKSNELSKYSPRSHEILMFVCLQ